MRGQATYHYRYWFDADISTAREETMTGNVFPMDIPVDGLSDWYHFLHFQVRDADGNWSSTVTKPFCIVPKSNGDNMDLTGQPCRYWFDADISTAREETMTGNVFPMDIPVDGLSDWYHLLHFQVRDADGNWSSTVTKPFCIVPKCNDSDVAGCTYRYWFDGNKETAVTGTLESNIIALDASITSLTDGEHTILFQVQDKSGFWSPVVSGSFLVSSTGLTIMATGGGTVSYGETSVRNDVANINVPEGMEVVLTIAPDEGFAVKQVMLNGTENVTELLEEGEGGEMTLRLKADSLMAVEVTFKLSDLSKLGDVNEDGKVSVSDVVLTADYLLGGTPQPFNLLLADANNDSNVDVADLVEEVRLISERLLRAPRHAPRQHEVNDALTAEMQGLSKIALCLQNTTAYTAFQMTISLPEGVSADDVQLAEDRRGNLQLVYRKLTDGRIRLVAYSMNNTPLKGHEGPLIELVTNGALQGEAVVEDILFVTPQGGIHAFSPMTISIADGVVTTKAATLGDGTAYDLAGRKTGLRTKRGIYIINGKKVIWK